MKIAIHGHMKSKETLVKDVALRLGLKRSPDFRKTSLREMGAGAKTMSSLKDKQEVLYYCVTDIIGRMQTYDMATLDFVTGVTYIDVLEEFDAVRDKAHTDDDKMDTLRLLAIMSLSYFDIVFVVPGVTLTIPEEVQEKIKVVALKGDSISRLTDEIVSQT